MTASLFRNARGQRGGRDGGFEGVGTEERARACESEPDDPKIERCRSPEEAPRSQGPLSCSWLSLLFYAPLGGSVTQDFSNHLSPGVLEIEVAVITEAGSCGSQLGALTKVMLDLAGPIVPGYAKTRTCCFFTETEVRSISLWSNGDFGTPDFPFSASYSRTETFAVLKANAEDASEARTPLEQRVVLDALVDEIKKRHRQAAERDARRALEQRRRLDEKRYASFVKSLNR